MRLTLCLLLLHPFLSFSQTLVGTVQDMETKKPLPYATVSIIGKNQRAITQRNGIFTLGISQTNASDSVTISYIGYQTATYALQDLKLSKSQVFQIKAQVYTINPVTITAQAKTQKIGFTKPGALRTGWGDFSSNRGRMRGVIIPDMDCAKTIKSCVFRIRNNDWDSVAFRFDLVSIKGGKIGGSVLPENIIIRTGAKNSWITVDLAHYGISHCGDVLATLEWVDAWGATGAYSNVLTLSLSKDTGTIYTKEASEYEGKLLTAQPPLALYLEVFSN